MSCKNKKPVIDAKEFTDVARERNYRVEEKVYYHLRVIAGGRHFDVWPTTGRVGILNSQKSIQVKGLGELMEVLASGKCD